MKLNFGPIGIAVAVCADLDPQPKTIFKYQPENKSEDLSDYPTPDGSIKWVECPVIPNPIADKNDGVTPLRRVSRVVKRVLSFLRMRRASDV